jgi:hypothetical protein
MWVESLLYLQVRTGSVVMLVCTVHCRSVFQEVEVQRIQKGDNA